MKYQQRKRREEFLQDVDTSYKPYQWSIVNKCYVDVEEMNKHRTYTVKAKFLDGSNQEHTIMAVPQSFTPLQTHPACQRVFELTIFDWFF